MLWFVGSGVFFSKSSEPKPWVFRRSETKRDSFFYPLQRVPFPCPGLEAGEQRLSP